MNSTPIIWSLLGLPLIMADPYTLLSPKDLAPYVSNLCSLNFYFYLTVGRTFKKNLGLKEHQTLRMLKKGLE